MANIMSMKSLKNRTSRNGFDLSFKKNFTAKSGELLPIAVKEVLPGDSFKINLKAFTRTQPVNTAAFARIREYYDFFFVPYDLLWNKANTVLTQMYDNPQHAVSLDPTQNFALNGEMPYTRCNNIASYLNKVLASSNSKNYFGYNRAKSSAKLLEYLGYGNFYDFANGTSWGDTYLMKNLELNLYGLLSYQKIYADYFRDSQWERISPSTFNMDYLTGSNMLVSNWTDSFVDNYNLFDLRYCNWQKDLFHGVLPRQQYGDVSMVPLQGTLSSYSPDGGTHGNLTPVTPFNQYDPLHFEDFSMKIDENGSAGFSILALRQYEFLQKWKEIAQSSNKDYKDQIEKHWGVSVGDGVSELCTYLGGINSSIDINEVVNTNITGSSAADIAGKGTSSTDGYISFDSNGRYGLLMCIYHCLPLLDYTSDMVDSSFMKVNATDYAIPEFDRVGMEAVPLFKMFNPNYKGATDYSELILGYAPRYIDYKTSVDYSVGAFKNTLSSWVISYGNQSIFNQLGSKDPTNDPIPSTVPINYTMFKVNPNCLNSLFAVNVDDTVNTDQFLCSTYFDIKAVRNLDVDGLPY